MTHAERRDRRRMIVEGILSGIPIRQVAAEFGVDVVTVRAACKERNVPCRSPRGRSNQLRILSLLFGGKDETAVGRKLGIWPALVNQVATRAAAAGIDIPAIVAALKEARRTP